MKRNEIDIINVFQDSKTVHACGLLQISVFVRSKYSQEHIKFDILDPSGKRHRDKFKS